MTSVPWLKTSVFRPETKAILSELVASQQPPSGRGRAAVALGPRRAAVKGQGRREREGWAVRHIAGSPCSMSGMISGGHNPLGTPGTSPSQNDLASLIQA